MADADPWIPGTYWDAALIPPVRCAQCRRYLPSPEPVEQLLADFAALCDECDWMRRR